MDNSNETASAGMTTDRWARLKSLFEEAIEMPEPERARFLAIAEESDPNIGREVRKLLEDHDRSSNLFDRPLLSKGRILEYFDAGLRVFQPGDTVGGRFLIDRFLGEGGMGEVYAAHDQELAEVVALKTLRPTISADTRMVESFKQEVHLARRVTHPNVCRIFDLFWHHAIDGAAIAVLSMEYLEGETLLRHVRAHGRLRPEAAWPIARQIAQGLAAAHSVGIVHGDFKTSNVMLVPQADHFRAVVTDFGLAHEQSSSPERRLVTFGELAGTPAYMAPEQLSGAPLSPSVDIYALGVVLFQMVTGHLPFDADTAASVARQRLCIDPPSPKQYVPNINPRWEATILRCLDPKPEGRPGDALQVVELLNKRGSRVTRRALLAASVVVAAAAFPAARYLSVLGSKPFDARALASFKRAQEFSKRRNEEGLLNAVEEYGQALRYEPNRAEIWIGLADAYSALANFQFMDPRQALPKAREAAMRAIQIDPSSGRAQGVLAYCMSIDLQQWLRAEPYFQKAIRLAPRDPQVRLWFASHLAKLGRVEEALAQLKAGLNEEPTSLALNQQLATEYFLSGRTQELQAQARDLIRLQPFEATAHLIMARAFEQLGDYANALRSCDKAEEYHHSMGALCLRGSIEASQGNRQAALKIAHDVERYWNDHPFDSVVLAALYARIGDSEKSLDILLAGCDRNDSSVLYAPQHPHLISIRQLSRYGEFLTRLGLARSAQSGRAKGS